MAEYHEMTKEASEARIGADRMAAGLPCLPDPIRGDLAEIERLRAAAKRVCWFDWCENDDDAVAAIEELRHVLRTNQQSAG